MPEAWGWEEEVCFQRVLRWPCLVPISRPITVRSSQRSTRRGSRRAGRESAFATGGAPGTASWPAVTWVWIRVRCLVRSAARFAHGTRLECMCPRRQQRPPLAATHRMQHPSYARAWPETAACAAMNSPWESRVRRGTWPTRTGLVGTRLSFVGLERVRSARSMNMLARIVRSDLWRQLSPRGEIRKPNSCQLWSSALARRSKKADRGFRVHYRRWRAVATRRARRVLKH